MLQLHFQLFLTFPSLFSLRVNELKFVVQIARASRKECNWRDGEGKEFRGLGVKGQKEGK